MPDTYCGKSCESCKERQELQCPGCRVGPGKAYGGDCSIAKCCIKRGHHACEFCTTASTCFNLKSRHTMAEHRLKEQIDAAERQRKRFNRSKLLSVRLGVLFWLVIASNVTGLIFGFLGNQSGMKLVSESISLALGVAYAVILLMLSDTSNYFRTAGICSLIVQVCSFAASLLDQSELSVMVSLVLLAPTFISTYQEYMGYVEVTEDMAEDVAHKWTNLWYWNLGCIIAMGIGLGLFLFGSGLGVLAVLVSAVLTLVIAVIKIVYLFSTVCMFRDYVEKYQYLY